MSNAQHMLVRGIALAVLVALHWFPHTHVAPLVASSGTSVAASSTASTGSNAANQATTEPSDTDAVGVATIP